MGTKKGHPRSRFLAVLSLCVCLTGVAGSSTAGATAQVTPTTAVPPFAAKLQPLLQSRMRQYRIPGAIVYVDIPGQGTWLKTMGTGDLSTKAPLDPKGCCSQRRCSTSGSAAWSRSIARATAMG